MTIVLLLLVLAMLAGAEQNCSEQIETLRFEASSSYAYSVGPHQARLRNQGGGGAWCPQSLIKKTTYTEEFLEIVLEKEFVVRSVITQGRFAGGMGQEFAEHIVLQYWRPGDGSYRQYVDSRGNYILEANKDTNTEVQIPLDTPIVASKVRILPFSFHARTVCLRVGLTGCEYKGGSPTPLQGIYKSIFVKFEFMFQVRK